MAGLAGSKNVALYTVHAMQLYRVQGLTLPIHACAVRFMNFGAETKFRKRVASFPGPAQLSVIYSKESGRGPGIFSHVSDVRIERVVERV